MNNEPKFWRDPMMQVLIAGLSILLLVLVFVAVQGEKLNQQTARPQLVVERDANGCVVDVAIGRYVTGTWTDVSYQDKWEGKVIKTKSVTTVSFYEPTQEQIEAYELDLFPEVAKVTLLDLIQVDGTILPQSVLCYGG